MNRRRYLMALANVPQFRLKTYENIYHNLIVDTLDNRPVRNQGIDKLVKIEGNGEIVNQLVQNGNFSEGTNNWTAYNGTFSVSNNVATFVSSDYSTARFLQSTAVKTQPNHKYLLVAIVKCDKAGTCKLEISRGWIVVSQSISANTQTLVEGFLTPTDTSDSFDRYQLFIDETNANYTLNVYETYVIDLTQMFGTGNEPTDLTDNRIKKLLAQYHIYNSGTYKGSIVDSIETKGFNIWDEEWEVGGISGSTGQNETWSGGIRAKNYNQILSNELYYVNKTLTFYFYDENKNYITYLSVYGTTFTTPSNAKYFRFARDTSGQPYNHDICINRSSSRNGEYVPFATINLCSGNLTSSDNYSFTPRESGTYTFSIPTSITQLDCWCQTDGAYVKRLVNASVISVNLESGKEYWFAGNDGSWGALARVSWLMLNKGSVALPYTPFGYFNNIIQLPAPIQLDGAINSHNTFEVLKDSYKFTRNVFSVDLSSLSWNWETNDERWYATYTDIKAPTTTNSVIDGLSPNYISMSILEQNDWEQTGIKKNGIAYYSNNIYCRNGSSSTQPSGILKYALRTQQVISIPRKHLKAVDLGSLSWSYNGNVRLFNATLNDSKHTTKNLFCSKYQAYELGGSGNDPDLCVFVYANVLYLTDYSCSSVNDLLNKASSIYLFYETENEVDDFINEEAFQRGGEITTNEMSWVENQIVELTNATITDNGISIQTYTSGKATVVVNNPTGYNQVTLTLHQFPVGHKLLFVCNYVSGIILYLSGVSDISSGNWIGIVNSSSGPEIHLYVGQTTANGTYNLYPQVIDLTLAFGIGNEPTSVNDYRIQDILNKGYIPTNTSGTYENVNSECLPNVELKIQVK